MHGKTTGDTQADLKCGHKEVEVESSPVFKLYGALNYTELKVDPLVARRENALDTCSL